MLTRVLIVEPDVATRARLQQAATAIADVYHHPEFLGARKRLFETSFDVLVTNLRLGPYTGLHLVYLVAAYDLSTRCVVYTDQHDLGLARDVQDAGAFYETLASLPVTLTAYLRSALPARDRRDPAVPDRRATVRGGRRCWDQHIADLSH